MARPVAWCLMGMGWGLAAVLSVALSGALRQSPIPMSPIFLSDRDDGLQHRLTLDGVRTLDDFAAAMQAAYARPVQMHRTQIEFAASKQLVFAVPEMDVANAFRLLNAQVSESNKTLSWRSFPTHVEIGASEYFDRLETERRVYDLSWTVGTWVASASPDYPRPDPDSLMRRAIDLVESVEPDQWRDNGGDLASIQWTGTSLIIEAPKSWHAEIQGVLMAFDRAAQASLLRTRTGPVSLWNQSGGPLSQALGGGISPMHYVGTGISPQP
jgi:hypothetical protein